MRQETTNWLWRGWLLLAAGVIAILVFSAAAQHRVPAKNRGSSHVGRTAGVYAVRGPATPASTNYFQVRSYSMDLAGDHSLEVATVTEQASAGITKYTIQLHLASGAEQSIAVSAPPGGLQLEMHDMTGDKVPNDLVLRPAWLQNLPTVLLNDGHDHFAVAISGPEPGSMSPGKELAPRERDDQGAAALLSSGFKTGSLINDGGLFLPQAREEILSPATQAISPSLGHSSSSGRAPPSLVITA